MKNDNNKKKTDELTDVAVAPEKTKKSKAKSKKKSEPVFVSHNGAEYEKLRGDKEMRKKFDALCKPIFAELKKGFKSDVACDFVFKMYKDALSPIRDGLVALREELKSKIEEFKNGGGVMSIDNSEMWNEKAVSAGENILDCLDSVLSDITKKMSDLSNLLNLSKQDINIPESADFIRIMFVRWNQAYNIINSALDKIGNVQKLREVQNLYCDKNVEDKICEIIETAQALINELFGYSSILSSDLKNVYTDYGSKVRLLKTSKDLSVKNDELLACINSLESYMNNYEADCERRRNEDIEKLKILTDRVSPEVPPVHNQAFKLVLSNNNCTWSAQDVKFEEGDAVLAISDILRMYSTERGNAVHSSNLPVFSIEALIKLGLITSQAKRVWIIDNGYPVDHETKDKYCKKTWICNDDPVYFSKSAVDYLTKNKATEGKQ